MVAPGSRLQAPHDIARRRKIGIGEFSFAFDPSVGGGGDLIPPSLNLFGQVEQYLMGLSYVAMLLQMKRLLLFVQNNHGC